MKHIFSVLFLMILCLMAACTQDNIHNPEESDKAHIVFNPMEIGMTRAVQTTTATISSYGVSSSVYDASSTYSAAACGSYFFNEEVTAATGVCKNYWPGTAYRISFFAYAPYGNNALTLSSAKDKVGRPVYSYTVPSNVTNQLDVITTEVLDMSGTTKTTPVQLKFHHRLSDIRFSAFNQNAAEPITIKKITIYGVKYSGTLEGEEWSLGSALSTASTGECNYSPNLEVTAGTTLDVTGTSGHFMILPQTATPTFVIVTTENGSERTYTTTLNSSFNFQMGKSYTFKLTLGDGTLIVDTDTDIQDWAVETKYLTVNSVGTNGTWSQPSVTDGQDVGIENWVEEE